ncbi:acyltransferase family protein [Pseudomonas ficuserectae]|uniref:acyltransferase family protein n=1 Tax=Pseudomonas ficuserectae TaxID=53410 RepID=UPI00211C4ACA|nr:acyltransferase [Pseudomonas ficuserectae]
MKKVEEIEILRAVAILFTLFQHLGPLLMPSKEAWAFINMNNPYWGGVDLFFCISGFVISKSMFQTWHDLPGRERWVEIRLFWIRRFFRIVPTLWLWVGLSLIATVYFNHSGAFGPLWPNVMDSIAAVLNYSNIHVFLCVIGTSSCGPNPVYWSLSLEEQFYLLLPLLFFLPKKRLILIVVVLVLIQLPVYRMPWHQTVGGALWFIRTDAILLGVLIAYFSTTDVYSRLSTLLEDTHRHRLILFLSLVALLSIMPRVGFYFAAGGIAIVSGMLVLLASFDKGFLVPKAGILAPFLWVGTRSFSLYLLHFPIYYAVNELAFRFSGFDNQFRVPLTHDVFNPVLAIATWSAVFIAAECNYRFVETPLRKIGRRFGRTKVVVAPHSS